MVWKNNWENFLSFLDFSWLCGAVIKVNAYLGVLGIITATAVWQHWLAPPRDEIQPLHAHSSEIANTLTTTNIKISQKEIEEMICKLKVKKATGPDGVPARLLKSAF